MANSNEIYLPNNWTPRPYQENLWKYLSSGGKRAVALWPRRSGKDDVFLHHTCCSAHERVGNYWYLLPEYAQARKSMWDAVNSHSGKRRIDEAFPHELRATTREDQMMIVFKNGSTFQLVGSDNFNSLVGSPPVGLVFSEYALSDPTSWSYLMPIVEENGGWVGFNSTPRGRNHFFQLCQMAEKRDDWFFEKLTADDTKVFSQQQLSDICEQLQSQYGDEYGKSFFTQEYYASFDAAIPGSIWGDCIDKAQKEGRIGVVPLEPGVEVCTAWDLGRTDATAVWWFQVALGSVRVVDYLEANFKDVAWFGNELRKRAKERGFTYGTHYLPTDAKQQHMAAGGQSVHSQMIEQDVGRVHIVHDKDHMDGIQAARATFPYVWIDETRCEKGIEVLRHYHYEWDEETKAFALKPEHDWASHGASAWRCMSLAWKVPKRFKPGAIGEGASVEGMVRGSVAGATFGELKRKHFAARKAEREAFG
jgi:phage terminase large subunit